MVRLYSTYQFERRRNQTIVQRIPDAQRAPTSNSVAPADTSQAAPPALDSTLPVPVLGFIRSCYPTRNGTPRQPCLVPSSRGIIYRPSLTHQERDDHTDDEDDDAPPSPDSLDIEWGNFLDTLQRPPLAASPLYLWIVFVFHTNTNHHKQSFRPKIRPPRLGTSMVGAFATRTPHRPNPIGLSLCRVDKVQRGMIFISGLDLVDGTPVLALQPYAQGIVDVSALTYAVPEWLNDPIPTQNVVWKPEAEAELGRHWGVGGGEGIVAEGGQRRKCPPYSLFQTADEIKRFIQETLSFDIRSVRHKSKGMGKVESLVYRVYLDTVDVVWRLIEPGFVEIEEIIILEKPGSSPLNPESLNFWESFVH